MPGLIDEPYKPISWIVCGLKVIFHLTYIILWICQAIFNPFKQTFNDSNRLAEGAIMAAVFALSIIFFFAELYFFYTFNRQRSILNLHICMNTIKSLIYFSLTLALTILTISSKPIWDLYYIMTASLWVISALTLIQNITFMQKNINRIFFKLVKAVFIGIYLTFYIIQFIKFAYYNSLNDTGYFKNLLISFIIGIINLVYDTSFVFKRRGNESSIENHIIDIIIPITCAMLYFGVFFTNTYFLLGKVYAIIDGLVIIIMTCYFVEIICVINKERIRQKLLD